MSQSGVCESGECRCESSDALVTTFGGVGISVAGKQLRLTSGNRRLLAVLVAAGPKAATSERIADELWLDKPPEPWRPALRMAVARLRKKLPGDWQIIGGAGAYRLDVCRGRVDAWLLEEVMTSPDPLIEDDIERFIAGPPFVAIDGRGLIEAARHALGVRRRAAVRRFCEQQPAHLRTSTSIAMTSLVRENPSDESLAVTVGRALMFAGHRTQAETAMSTFSSSYFELFETDSAEVSDFLSTRGPELLQQILEASPDIAFVRSANGTYLAANEAYAELYGCRPEDISGHIHADFATDPGQVEHVASTDRQVFETGQPLVLDTPMAFRGKRRWFQVTKTPLFGSEDTVVGTYTVARDTSDSHQASELLRRQNQWLLDFSTTVSNALAKPELPLEVPMLLTSLIDLADACCASLFLGPDDPHDMARASQSLGQAIRTGTPVAPLGETWAVAARTWQTQGPVRGDSGRITGFPVGHDLNQAASLVLETDEQLDDDVVDMVEQAAHQILVLMPAAARSVHVRPNVHPKGLL